MSETKKQRRPWTYFGGGLITGIVLVILLVAARGACAVTQCTPANPCIIGAVTYTTGNRCTAETSDCGYWGDCITRLTGTPAAPDCDCSFF